MAGRAWSLQKTRRLLGHHLRQVSRLSVKLLPKIDALRKSVPIVKLAGRKTKFSVVRARIANCVLPQIAGSISGLSQQRRIGLIKSLGAQWSLEVLIPCRYMCWPVKMQARLLQQIAVVTKALLNSVPRRARRSRWGVWMWSLPMIPRQF